MIVCVCVFNVLIFGFNKSIISVFIFVLFGSSLVCLFARVIVCVCQFARLAVCLSVLNVSVCEEWLVCADVGSLFTSPTSVAYTPT